MEQLEKQLHLVEPGLSEGAATTTPATFKKELYKKVLQRTLATSKWVQTRDLQPHYLQPNNARRLSGTSSKKFLKRPTTSWNVESKFSVELLVRRHLVTDSNDLYLIDREYWQEIWYTICCVFIDQKISLFTYTDWKTRIYLRMAPIKLIQVLMWSSFLWLSTNN